MAETPLSPEVRLVFRAADPAATPAELRAVAATLGSDLARWERVMILAERELATAALARGLRGADALLPGPPAEYLRKSAMMSDFRMQRLSTRVQETLRALEARAVPVCLLKGAAVGAYLDPTFRARPMMDVDLLVHPADAARAVEALRDAGWQQTTDPMLQALLADEHHLPPFYDPQFADVRLELHTAILPADHSFGFDAAAMWRDARPAGAPFAAARVPSPAHLLLHTCVHFAWQHTMEFGAWRSFRVLGALAAREDLDWDAFIRLARDTRAATACHWTFRLAVRMGALPVPASVIAALAPPTPERVCKVIERSVIATLAPGEGPTSPSIRLSRLLWRAALRPAWSGHRSPGRWDPEHRWERARGERGDPTLPAKLRRHLAAYRAWWRFLRYTVSR